MPRVCYLARRFQLFQFILDALTRSGVGWTAPKGEPRTGVAQSQAFVGDYSHQLRGALEGCVHESGGTVRIYKFWRGVLRVPL